MLVLKIVFGIVIVLLITLIILIVRQRVKIKSDGNQAEKEIIIEAEVGNESGFSRLIEDPVIAEQFTGAAREKDPSELEQESLDQAHRLKKMVPVRNNSFEIEFNGIGKFIVTIYNPSDANRKVFNQWLNDNEIDMIEANRFEFVIK